MHVSDSPQLTDLYQLTMLQIYLDQQMQQEAVFEFYVRTMPPQRNFLIAAGLEQLLDFLERARFSADELEYLAGSGFFQANLIEYLAHFRFSGDVHAMAEGTVFFSNEPILRITAPLPEAQLIETRLINLLQLPILVATKAARCRLAAPDKLLIDFGLRRAHGAEAGLLASRASYLGGIDGTSNVLAGQLYGLPIMGTMAHSYIQAHEREQDAFRHFADSQPDNLVLLIDTYDTSLGAQRAAELADEVRSQGVRVKAVRIDSGVLGEEARRVREILDKAGHPGIGIFASSGIDEYLISELGSAQAPINGYGIGTSLVTSDDMPYLNCAYKLQEYAGVPRRKRSHGKATWPGRKQIYRYYDEEGQLDYDRLCSADETGETGQPQLQQVMQSGQRLAEPEPLEIIRERTAQQLKSLPNVLRDLSCPCSFEPQISDRLRQMAQQIDERFGGG